MAKVAWNTVGYGALAFAALGLVGVGAWMVYPPAGLIAPGLMIWVDITLGALRR